MKYQYKTNTDTVEIEVNEEWANVLIELDRHEYNDNHRETRRHCSFELYSREGAEIASDLNVLQEILLAEDIATLHKSMKKLEPRQRYLLHEIYFIGRSQTEIAEEEGVSPQAIHQAVNRAIKKLKKYFDLPV